MTERSGKKLEFGDDGFTVVAPEGGRTKIQWRQVREIVAFREDPDGKDLMCLGFRISNERNYVEISEETPDGQYQKLLERMCEALPEINRNWWQEVAEAYGTTTIYGISQSLQTAPSAAERYLTRAKKRKPLSPRVRRRIIPVACVVVAAAAVQSLLSWWIAGGSNVVAVALWPMLLVVAAARLWPNPRLFFLLLAAYHVAELLLHFALAQPGPCLLSKLLAGRFQYLLVLGVEILIGMGMMLLPDKNAAN